MKVLLLCGGRGVIDPETRVRVPKCLLKIGNKPLIWHVMKLFSSYGHVEFILALGQGGELIKSFFMNAFEYLHDVELNLVSKETIALNSIPEENWNIKLIDTGITARTGARIARCERYIKREHFLISYSDILSDVNINELIEYHEMKKKILTVTGVNPPSRFGTFFIDDEELLGYNSNAMLNMQDGRINGGFMVADHRLFSMLSPITECNLEGEVFDILMKQNEITLFKHNGFWQNVDTERDIQYLQDLYEINKRPWMGIN
jgi:glucose-1-phosphate cytidylyltransferase